MTNILYPKDYNFGKEKECEVLPELLNYFKREIKMSESNFAKHDFYDDEYNYELKSRSFNYRYNDEYQTTMITEDKLDTSKPLILLFNFDDGLYYIEYNLNKFKQYKVDLFSRAKVKSNEKDHVYIPKKDLICIKDKVPKCLLKIPNKKRI